MNKPNFATIANGIRTYVVKHSPGIMTGLAIGGMATTAIFAAKATPKATELIEEKKREEGVDKLTVIETVKTAGKCYIPATITFALSTACMIGAHSVNAKRNAALAAAYGVAETTLKEYQNKVVETIGKKKEESIREAIAKDRVDKCAETTKEIIITGQGNALCYDMWSDRIFYSDIETIKKTVNDLNRRMRNEMYVSLNEFYTEIGLNPTPGGDRIGWNIDRGYIDIHFSSHLYKESTPCLAIEFYIAPEYEYDKLV